MKIITATEPQPHRIILKYFVIFKNVAHCLEPGEKPSKLGVSSGPKLCTTLLNIAKHGEITTQFDF